MLSSGKAFRIQDLLKQRQERRADVTQLIDTTSLAIASDEPMDASVLTAVPTAGLVLPGVAESRSGIGWRDRDQRHATAKVVGTGGLGQQYTVLKRHRYGSKLFYPHAQHLMLSFDAVEMPVPMPMPKVQNKRANMNE